MSQPYRDPETGARPTPEPSLPLFESGLSTPYLEGTQCENGGCPNVGVGVLPSNVKGSPREIAHARRSDPIHSHEASRSVVNLGRTRDGIIDILKLKGPLTDEQIWAAYSAWYDRGRTVPRSSPSGLRSRRAELVRMGFVCEGGTGKTASGRACTIWGIAEISLNDERRTR